jgi:hypothetical protein
MILISLLFFVGLILSLRFWYTQDMQGFTFAAIDTAFTGSILLLYLANRYFP